MAYVGGATSWRYCLTVDECLADDGPRPGDRVRVCGEVAANSLHVAPHRRQARFFLAATDGKLQVICSGQLPDNLAERTQIVVEGRLERSGLLRGERILSRCAGKYEPQQHSARPDNVSRTEPEAHG